MNIILVLAAIILFTYSTVSRKRHLNEIRLTVASVKQSVELVVVGKANVGSDNQL